MRFILYFIFFISGISGLIYQVIWVREFGQIFGNTVASASLIAGTFVFGLGLGSYWAGKFVDRKHVGQPKIGLKYYVIAEFLIALFGLLLSIGIPEIERISPLISLYQQSANGWFELSPWSVLARALIALFLVGPITVVMGATLTFLIRFLLAHSVENAGWKVGVLYGLNTLGAALGCGLVDLWAIPTYGLMATKLGAVVLNLLAGSFAFVLFRMSKAPIVEPVTISKGLSSKIWPAALAIGISGFCAMGMEIVWFRFFSSLFSSRRIAFSITLVTILIGIWLGAFIGGYLTKKIKNASWLYALSQMAFAVSTLAGFYIFIYTDRSYFVASLVADLNSGNANLFKQNILFLIPALKIAFVPALMMGAAFPILNQIVQRHQNEVGGNVGTLYLWNSVGAIIGSAVTGFLFLPFFGMKITATILAIGALVAVVPIAKGLSSFKLSLTSAVVFCLLAFWISLPQGLLVENAFLENPFGSNMKLLETSEGINETAMIVEDSTIPGEKFLFTNGHRMSGQSYMSQRYMRAFAHLPLLQLNKPESALVICFGVGNTVHAVSLHPSVKQIDVVDLSKNVLSLAENFASTNQSVLKGSRTNVFVNDGRQHLRMQKENTYDLITLEPPPLVSAGVASLYSKEFYQLAMRALKKDGFLTQWLPIYQIQGEHAKMLVKAFLEVFPNAVLLNGFGRELILIGQKEGLNQIDWLSFAQNLSSRPLVQADLIKIDLSRPEEWLGTFMASAQWLNSRLAGVSPMTDDKPIIEYTPYILHTDLPRELFWAGSLSDWCPTCFSNGKFVAELELLPTVFSMLQTLYSSDSYIKIRVLSDFINLNNIPVTSEAANQSIDKFIGPIQVKTYNVVIDRVPAMSKIFGRLQNTH